MNFFDRLISIFSPSTALKRVQSRMALDVAHRNYDAAAKGRRTNNWKASSTSANSEIATTLVTLRNRSRDMVRNNDYAENAVDSLTTNIVGTGIRPSFSKITKTKAAKIKELFNDWAESTECDFDGNTNFYGLQELAVRSMIESGECLVVKRINPNPGPARVALQLQLMESDHLDTLKDGMFTAEGGIIRQGVEFDKDGRKIAYWIFLHHPGDYGIPRRFESVRFDVKDVLLISRPKRVGQIRCAPTGVTTFNKLRDLEEFTDATRIQKKVAACFSVFVKDSAEPLPGMSQGDGGYQMERIEPGMIEYLQPGQEVAFASPPPSDGYSEYVNHNLQGVAAGYGVTYEQLTGDYSRVNFTSGRMGHISNGAKVELWQRNTVIPKFCNPIAGWFLQLAEIQGLIPGSDQIKITWTLPARAMISPVEETKAKKDQIRGGLKAWQDSIRESGQEPDEVLRKMAEDVKLFDTYGLILDVDPRQTDGQGQTPTRIKNPQSKAA